MKDEGKTHRSLRSLMSFIGHRTQSLTTRATLSGSFRRSPSEWSEPVGGLVFTRSALLLIIIKIQYNTKFNFITQEYCSHMTKEEIKTLKR